MTNYEKIKTMSVEEMAAFLCKHYECLNCPVYERCNKTCGGFVKWLESEAKR